MRTSPVIHTDLLARENPKRCTVVQVWQHCGWRPAILRSLMVDKRVFRFRWDFVDSPPAPFGEYVWVERFPLWRALSQTQVFKAVGMSTCC